MEYLRDSGLGEDDKSAINFHKLILLNLLILCEPKQNKWELWGKWGIRGCGESTRG